MLQRLAALRQGGPLSQRNPLRVGALRASARHRARCTNAARSSEACSPPPCEPPSYLQLFRHARLAAVPMVGFGFMDNIIMIQAGDFIDSTLGVTFGFSTLTAAAFGNICSDTSGCLFGGIVETASEKLRLPGPKFTAAQASMRIVRVWGTGGAVVGVICGCLLGMTQLFVLDLEKSERLKKAAELDKIFESVVANGHLLLGCERVSLYMWDANKKELWTKISVEGDDHHKVPIIISLPLDNNALACAACRTHELINIPNAYDDPRHDASWDAKFNFKSKEVMCLPIFSDGEDGGELVGCIQAVNRISPSVPGEAFPQESEKLMRMLASHIATVVKVLS